MSKPTLDIHEIHKLHQDGLLDEAKAGYQALLKQNPKNIDALHALGILYAQEDNLPEAIHCLETAVRYQPDNPVLTLHLANVLKTQGLFSHAADMLNALLKNHPNYIPALNNLGGIYYAQGKLDDAIHCYQQAIQQQPEYMDAYYNLALALTKQNKFDEAIQTYQQLLAITPDHSAALFLLASLYMQQDDITEAIKQFNAVAAIQPNHFETQTNLATCYLKLGDFDKAKTHYLYALDLAHKDTQVLFNLGFICMQQGQVDNAIQYYQLATQFNPEFYEAHNNLGVAFLAKQHISFALQHFKAALRLHPENQALQYTVNALSKDQRLLAAPVEYVKSLFDAYADHYEPHLLTALEYKVPDLLYQAVAKVTAKKDLAILDLGCGTGLCGMVFQPKAKTLVGVDLSEKMLAVAAQKNIYTELKSDDILDYLTQHTHEFDLILSGDVFVYIGDLADTFKRVHHALKPGGLFAFNCELNETQAFTMNQSGRFAHSKQYIDQLAKENNFKIVHYSVAKTRMQNNEPVFGHIYVLNS